MEIKCIICGSDKDVEPAFTELNPKIKLPVCGKCRKTKVS